MFECSKKKNKNKKVNVYRQHKTPPFFFCFVRVGKGIGGKLKYFFLYTACTCGLHDKIDEQR